MVLSIALWVLEGACLVLSTWSGQQQQQQQQQQMYTPISCLRLKQKCIITTRLPLGVSVERPAKRRAQGQSKESPSWAVQMCWQPEKRWSCLPAEWKNPYQNIQISENNYTYTCLNDGGAASHIVGIAGQKQMSKSSFVPHKINPTNYALVIIHTLARWNCEPEEVMLAQKQEDARGKGLSTETRFGSEFSGGQQMIEHILGQVGTNVVQLKTGCMSQVSNLTLLNVWQLPWS